METSAQKEKLPKLIDRELFFGNPEISGAQISPDGKYIAFIKPLDEVRNVWIKERNEPFENAIPVTDEKKRPIPAYFWSHDSKFILFVKDNDGDENYNVYAVNPNAEIEEGKAVPEATNLTNAEKVTTQIYELPESEPDFIYIGLNDRDEAWHDLYKVQISTGEKTLLQENKDRLIGFVFDNDDKLRLAMRSAVNGDTEILRVDGDEFTKIYSCGVFEDCFPIHFHKDNQLFYLVTNKGERDLKQLVLFDPKTLKEEFVEQDPEDRVDLSNAIFSDLTDELIVTAYEDEKVRYYWKDKEFEKDYEWLKEKLPGMEISLGSSTKDENTWIIAAHSDTEPGKTYLFDRKEKNLTLQYKIREKLPREALSKMEPIRYKSSDGLEIPAYLTLPNGVEEKDLPLVVVPHGGPWHRDVWGYNPMAQFLANRGYAVLQMNFRGSIGYGKNFLDASNKQWGDLMQDDITWGVKHLVEEGIADPKRVGIMGGSYGGYATLAGVTFTPDLYAAAVAIVAPSNLITLINSIPPYWEAYKKVFLERMGDPTTEEGEKELLRQSPLSHVEKIKTPLMIVQGANDPRVKKAEADQIVVALRERNYPVVYLLAEDEGHGFARPVNNMAMYAEAEKFLAKFLNGRFQEEMPDDVEKRLEELKVNVETVKMPEKMDVSKLPAPNPVMDLKPSKTEYAATLELGGQEMSLSVKSEIKKENGDWIITENIQTLQGEINESSVVEKDSLKLKKRSFSQAGIDVLYEIQDNRAIGEMTLNGETKEINKELSDKIFADGTGSFNIIATLPLEEHYKTSYKNYDVQTDKIKTMILEVVGDEKVEVPAGEFNAFKVNLTSDENDNTTAWIDKETRKVVKIKSVIAQMNGAVLTSKLVS